MGAPESRNRIRCFCVLPLRFLIYSDSRLRLMEIRFKNWRFAFVRVFRGNFALKSNSKQEGWDQINVFSHSVTFFFTLFCPLDVSCSENHRVMKVNVWLICFWLLSFHFFSHSPLLKSEWWTNSFLQRLWDVFLEKKHLFYREKPSVVLCSFFRNVL